MNFEDRIKEIRTTEATKKNLIGMEGKLYLIARFLGHEIISQSSDQSFLDNFWEDVTENDDIPILDESTRSSKLGYYFDGMSRGHHLEIYTNDNINEIKMYYKGNIFYHESFGVLEKYIPHQEWETIIENLFIECNSRIQKFLKTKKQNEEKQFEKLENKTLEEIRKKWGDII